MNIYYIIATTKASQNDESEILEYLVNQNGDTNSGIKYKKEDFWEKIKETYKNDSFYCLSAHSKRECFWEFDKDIPYLKTRPNWTEIDNLLSLPGIASS